MNKRLINRAVMEEVPDAYAQVSGGMVWDRAKELSLIAGRTMNNKDYGQALHELKGDIKVSGRIYRFPKEVN